MNVIPSKSNFLDSGIKYRFRKHSSRTCNVMLMGLAVVMEYPGMKAQQSSVRVTGPD